MRTPGRPAGERSRRLYGPALALGLLGAAGVSVGATRPWVAASARPPGLPLIAATATGSDLAPAAAALGLGILAAFGAVVATRGWVRRCLGALILFASVLVVREVVDPAGAAEALRSGLAAKGWSGGDYATHTELWRWLVLVSAGASAWAGAVTAWYGDRWAVMGSRYDAPRAAEAAPEAPDDELTEADVWRALDQGRDPTQTP